MNAQAWFTRATILQVQGEYDGALQSCSPLLRLAPGLVATACHSSVLSLISRADPAYQTLEALVRFPESAGVLTISWFAEPSLGIDFSIQTIQTGGSVVLHKIWRVFGVDAI